MGKQTKTNKRVYLWLGIALIPIVLILYAYFIEPFWIRTANYDLNSGGIQEKIVFVSDTHFGSFYGADKMKKVVDKINAQNPDLVILGGDYIDRSPNYASQFFEIVSKIRAKDGIYYALGNHDMNAHLLSLVKSDMAKDGFLSLDNQGFFITKGDRRIRVAGVGDYNYGTQDPQKAIGTDIKPNDYTILVSHNPDYLEEYKDNKANLYLSGHMHGGQIGIGFWYPILPSNYGLKYLGGLVKNDPRTIIVSKGIGMSLFPFRFGARPDIVVLNLK